ncbi:alkaline phosphatase-like protein [Thozetella sp. PMI_491]|nr:alkaline phosphatase-like protein [Thozetella sp. PMI_491]
MSQSTQPERAYEGHIQTQIESENPNLRAIDSTAKRPNLVIFMPDQLRYDALGFTGNKVIKTPNLDAFAKRSATFTNCFAQASVCAQSRCSMFLGQYPHISGHRSLDTLIQLWESDMFKGLKEAGYHVAHLSPRGHMYADAAVTEQRVHEYGFLVEPGSKNPWRAAEKISSVDKAWARLFYLGERELEAGFDFDEAVTRGAVEWLHNPAEEPFCLFLPLIWPHCPFEVEEPYFSMYDRSQMPEPVSLESKTGYEPMYMKAIRDEYGITGTTKEMWAEVSATYYGMITRLDDQFGRIMKAIGDNGLWDSTVTMFFTDHGEYLGDHGLIEKWPSGLSEPLVKEPLVIGGGGIPEGVVVDEMTEMVDLLPTVFELCAVKETFPHNGKSLMPLINKAPGYQHKEFAFSEGGFLLDEEWLLERARFPYDLKASLQHERTEIVGKATACRDHDWTYIHRLYEQAELYNRKQDPGERHNLSGKPQYAHIEAKYREVVFRWLVETADLMSWKRDFFFGPNSKISYPTPMEQLARRKEEPLDHPFRQ